jgi:hypothetical protein
VRHYGPLAEVLAAQWNNLCGIDNPFIELTVRDKIARFTSFLQAHHWLWTWPRNSVDLCFGKATWKCECHEPWDWIEKIALLAAKVISWDKGFDYPECQTHIISIDGFDMMAWERKQAYLSNDPAFCSHKSNGCTY